jgi:transposase
MTTPSGNVIGGVDTHADTHHAAVIDINGKHLGDAKFPTTPAGYAALSMFLAAFGTVARVGVEGTGSYGAGLTRYLRDAGLEVVEVIRPNRQLRRLHGKSDPIDAYAAATTALTESQHPVPKTTDGSVEAIRYLLVARRSAVKARTAAQVQIKALLVTAPTALRERFRSANDKALIEDLSRMRPNPADPLLCPIVTGLRSLAHRHQHLTGEIAELERALTPLVTQANPALTAAKGIGPVTAAQLLITAGDNPERLHSEAAFAALAGVSPIPASSGKTNRHRLNRGGDRQANAALHRIALVRMTYEPRTRDYIAKKRAEGRGNKEIIRCLKRAIAREIFTLLTTNVEVPNVTDLRPLRQARKISLELAAQHFGLWPARISDLERGKRRDDDFATTYREWLLAA